jgi:hypothetical protein
MFFKCVKQIFSGIAVSAISGAGVGISTFLKSLIKRCFLFLYPTTTFKLCLLLAILVITLIYFIISSDFTTVHDMNNVSSKSSLLEDNFDNPNISPYNIQISAEARMVLAGINPVFWILVFLLAAIITVITIFLDEDVPTVDVSNETELGNTESGSNNSGPNDTGHYKPNGGTGNALESSSVGAPLDPTMLTQAKKDMDAIYIESKKILNREKFDHKHDVFLEQKSLNDEALQLQDVQQEKARLELNSRSNLLNSHLKIYHEVHVNVLYTLLSLF